ncbi:quinone-dependent dihydroorotate dehydrogenase [Yoonia sp. BS5-3]|uniref:Dihydroorotate dehydrogenase (quinone) n=1 Tax=Yoonia phaeophyticola TaxID=3137369 RepID=A0ABZ2UZN4_9RHOB
MKLAETIGLAALRRIDPEAAHGLAIKALNTGLGPRGGPVSTARLQTSIAGLDLPNPIGLAAGFDKNATALNALARTGFGFLEVGAATPRPQPGNPKPRLFRLTEDQAAINRFGFNNDGMQAIAARLAQRPTSRVTGLNLGANKDSTDKAADFATVLKECGPHVDFATVNVSSPNTEKLRDLQGKAALSALLNGVLEANAALAKPIPIFLKIAPDLNADELADVAEVANGAGISAVIASNTTLDREGLHGPHKAEAGGLSGQPLFEKSTRVLAQLSTMTELPIIGVGGVGSAAQAYQKIRAGASAVQLYTALVYGGLSLVDEITRGLDALLARDGFDTVAQAVGSGRSDWL